MIQREVPNFVNLDKKVTIYFPNVTKQTIKLKIFDVTEVRRARGIRTRKGKIWKSAK